VSSIPRNTREAIRMDHKATFRRNATITPARNNPMVVKKYFIQEGLITDLAAVLRPHAA
jgi:hypothetical protein